MAIGTQWFGCTYCSISYICSVNKISLKIIFKTRLEITFSCCIWPVNNHFLPKLLFSFKLVSCFLYYFPIVFSKQSSIHILSINTYTNKKSMLYIPVHLQQIQNIEKSGWPSLALFHCSLSCLLPPLHSKPASLPFLKHQSFWSHPVLWAFAALNVWQVPSSIHSKPCSYSQNSLSLL